MKVIILTLLCLARAWAIDIWGYQDLGSNGFIDVDQDGFLYLIGLTLTFSNIHSRVISYLT
jgi:hypothetical protein